MSIAQTMRSTSGTNHAYVRRRVRSTGEIAHGGSLRSSVLATTKAMDEVVASKL